jgi:hypothetical protein
MTAVRGGVGLGRSKRTARLCCKGAMGAATRFESLGGLGLVAITAKADCALHLSDAVGRIRCARKRSACHICAGSGLTPHTSAPGVGSPRTHLHWDFAGPCLPHLRRDWAHACHICAGTGLTRCHICAGTGLTPAASAPGLGALAGNCQGRGPGLQHHVRPAGRGRALALLPPRRLEALGGRVGWLDHDPRPTHG